MTSVHQPRAETHEPRTGDERITEPTMENTRPAVVLDVDLTRPLPSVPAIAADGKRVLRAWVLVRLDSQPLGTVLTPVPEEGLGPQELLAAIQNELATVLEKRLEGFVPGTPSAFLERRAEVLRDAPPITVVICTRERPGALARCLDSLLTQDYPDFKILVVDNAPVTEATAEIVRSAARRGPVSYLREPKAGLSFARNAALGATRGETVAWIDDDEYADPNWLAEIARAFADHPEADVVSGVIVPAELETQSQLWFEQFGGHSKGRGFKPDKFSPDTAHIQSPLYPLPPFGTGANMTFRPGVIERVGGWDTALGAGTPAMGSEDTLAFMEVLNAGGTVVYQPSAVTFHYHRQDFAGLEKQMVGYGTGLTAAYTSLLLRRPGLIFALLRLVPGALRDLTSKDSLRVSTLQDDFPRELLSANRRGMIAGPRAYLKGRRAAKAKVRAERGGR
jgi:glycosyltransferase involved in cell wall biosynthesis